MSVLKGFRYRGYMGYNYLKPVYEHNIRSRLNDPSDRMYGEFYPIPAGWRAAFHNIENNVDMTHMRQLAYKHFIHYYDHMSEAS